jgi:uncharacterized membrane protein YgcG
LFAPCRGEVRLCCTPCQLATTGSDGFYTYYTYPGSKDGDCTNGGGEKTGTLVVHKFITDSKTDGTFEFNGPQGVFSITTVDGEGSATITGVTPGSYTLTENTQDGWHESAITTCMNVQITAGQTTNCNFYNTPDDGNNGCDDKQNCNPTACNSGEIWARVNVEDYANQGSGNVTNNIYLGSNANVIASGEWFMVYDGTNYINDPDITTYEDVPGLAVQRINGQVRVVLHGGNATEGDIEDISGNIEFFNGAVSSVSSDPSHPVEDGTNGTHDDGVTYSGDKSFFDLEVNTGNDGFYTNYAYQLDETCTNDGGGTTDVCPNIEGVQAVVPEGMHINNDGNCVNDDTNGGGTTDVCPNIDGIQTAIPEGQHLTEDGNCVDDGGNGGGGGGGSSSGGSGGSSHNQGEVLGAETGPTCARFNEYHDTGDTGGEIEALQTFLNEYMDAGLTVNGIYDWATTNAVHQFQAFHWNDIIDPWTPPLSPNTTGREYKTTVGTIDAIMGCPADPVFLEDPQTMYYIDKVQDQKPFTPDQIMKIANILDGVHGVTIGK